MPATQAALMQPETDSMTPTVPQSRPLLIVLSGPSGAGKDSIVDGLIERGIEFYRAITAVTREPRPGEVNGIHHHFLTSDEFILWLAEGRFLETAIVYGHRYGTPLEEVTKAMEAGRDVVLRVDVQGAASVRERMPESVLVFIGVPGLSLATLQARREGRSDETADEKAKRNALLQEELAAIPEFDYHVVNETGKLEEAIDKVSAIITAEKCRIQPSV